MPAALSLLSPLDGADILSEPAEQEARSINNRRSIYRIYTFYAHEAHNRQTQLNSGRIWGQIYICIVKGLLCEVILHS